MSAFEVEVIPANLEQAPVDAQLYELYTYEMTDLADFDIHDNGYYGYDELPSHWINVNRYPYLIWVNKKLAGFVLNQKGSPIKHDPDIWDIAKFFIMRKFRKKGIGQFVAQKLLTEFPGRWQIRVWSNNKTAHVFWQSVIEQFLKRTIIPTSQTYQGHEGLLVYFFNSPKVVLDS